MKTFVTLLAIAAPVSGIQTKVTTILERKADTVITGDLPFEPVCEYDGSLVFSHPLSLHYTNRYITTSRVMLNAMEMMVDYVNTERCGIKVADKTYSITLRTYGDDSSVEKVEKIANAVQSSTDFFFGPYSTGLNLALAPIAQENNKILVAAGTESRRVFRNNDNVFGILPRTSRHMIAALEALKEKGAKTVASVWEFGSFTENVCDITDIAESNGLNVTIMQEVPSSFDASDLDPIVEELKEEGPDVVLTCMYECSEWVKAMRRADWSPKAQVFTVCIGSDTFEAEVGDDVEYMMGVSPWHSDVSFPSDDGMSSWGARRFAQRFEEYSGRPATYHAASAAASISVLVQAIENVNSTESDVVKEALNDGTFDTVYGQVSFDNNGQNQSPVLLLQYDANKEVHTVYPEGLATADVLYPMPTWIERDCMKKSECQVEVGVCKEDGTCQCSDPDYQSIGIGEEASCVPPQDRKYLRK